MNRNRRLQAAGSALPLAVLLSLQGPANAGASPDIEVIVQAVSVRDVRRAVEASGGEILTELPIVSGAAARVPAASLTRLGEMPGIRAVTPDETVRVASEANDGPDGTVPQPSVFAAEIGAPGLWSQGVTGEGVRVALVDTGVTPVADLDGALAEVPDPRDPSLTSACVNLSGEATCGDSYGHGTFMAGLIAGSGASSGGRYGGVAPGAEIVSIKIAGRDGSADVSKVLAAIQWVVSFRRDLNIRVLNLSLGTDSTVSYRYDPLNLAVERAWRQGIVVVVSASNRGPDAGTISKPADDPLVVTVGAVDDVGTADAGDDVSPLFSGRGPTAADGLAKPDLSAPGAHLVSLKSPGSYVEENASGPGIDGVYRRGSGTSMAAAVTSGAAALYLQAHPSDTPNRVKFALTSTTSVAAATDPAAVGTGVLDVYDATRHAPEGLANRGVDRLSDGSGSLDGSRASMLIAHPCGANRCERPRGRRTGQERDFDAGEYHGSSWYGSSWYSSQWAVDPGSSWYGSSWYGSSWYGSSWYGAIGDGEAPQSAYGVAVAGSSWYGAWD